MTLFKLAAGAGIIALLAGLWFRGEWHAQRARTNEALLSSARAIAEANAALAEDQSRAAQKIDAVAAVNAIRKQDLRRKSDIRRKEIIDVPLEADGPLAPVLRDQLDRLPRRPGADARRDFAVSGNPVRAPSSN